MNTERLSPSFVGLVPASAAASRSKQSNRKTGTSIEKILGQRMWKLGLRYRKNPQDVVGRPDFVFRGAKLAVFCDGDFWHGKDWEVRKERLAQGHNPGYWLAKISRNMERDRQVTLDLDSTGWKVMRFWESDIRSDPQGVAELIKATVVSRVSKSPVPLVGPKCSA